MPPDPSRPASSALSTPQAGTSTWVFLAMLACAGLIILAAKWMLIDHYGVNVPYLDQWDAEARDFSRFEAGLLHWTDLFKLHNEHCIFTTRLWHLVWYVLNSQMWDVRLQMVVNAMVHTAALLLICRATIDTFRPGTWLPAVIILLAAGIIPMGWLNLLGGFQVQFYWALLFQVMAMLLWLGQVSLSWRWWTGILAYGLAIASMGSGGLIIFAVAGVLGLRAWKHRSSRDAIAGGVLLTIGCGFLLWSFMGSIEAHATLKAQSITEFLSVLLMGLGAPWMDNLWAAGLLWLPWLTLVGCVLVRRDPLQPLDERLLALGLWVIALAAAVAYARGAGGISPANRYMDNLIPGLLVNVSCLTRLAFMLPRPTVPGRRPVATAGLVLWLLLVTGGFIQSAQFHNPRDGGFEGWVVGLLNWHVKTQQMASNLHGYLTTSDMQYLTSRGHIPMMGLPENQKQRVQEQEVVNVLPAALLPVRLPKFVQTSGKGHWPLDRNRGAMLNTTQFGVTPGASNAEQGRANLIYEFPTRIRHFVVQVMMLPPNASDLALYCRSGSQTQVLISPQPHKHLYLGPLYFHTSSSTLALEIVDLGQNPGGILSITSPIPMGRMSYWMERLLPWSPLMAIVGFIGMLYCCRYLGWPGLARSPTCDETA